MKMISGEIKYYIKKFDPTLRNNDLNNFCGIETKID